MNNSLEADVFTLNSSQVCQTLGISRDTLYAYVSRGMVRTIAHPQDARKSLYDRRDIETLRARQSRGRSRRSVAESTIHWGEPVLNSNITKIADGRFMYRGKDAVDLSRSHTFEDIAFLLSRVRCRPLAPNFHIDPDVESRPFNRILTMMAEQANTQIKGDGRPYAGRIMRLTALQAAGVSVDPATPIHEILANSWSEKQDAPALIRRALVLCADHELNASAYATRVAASAGASLPASLLAGLATLSGSLHGGITARCRAWMEKTEKEWRLGETHDPTDKAPPGFGHPLYPDGDPRARSLLQSCGISDRWKSIISQVHDATGHHPSLDFALAHLERQLELPDGSGLGIFAVGRTAGWIAHIFEQRETGRLIRPRAAATQE